MEGGPKIEEVEDNGESSTVTTVDKQELSLVKKSAKLTSERLTLKFSREIQARRTQYYQDIKSKVFKLQTFFNIPFLHELTEMESAFLSKEVKMEYKKEIKKSRSHQASEFAKYRINILRKNLEIEYCGKDNIEKRIKRAVRREKRLIVECTELIRGKDSKIKFVEPLEVRAYLDLAMEKLAAYENFPTKENIIEVLRSIQRQTYRDVSKTYFIKLICNKMVTRLESLKSADEEKNMEISILIPKVKRIVSTMLNNITRFISFEDIIIQLAEQIRASAEDLNREMNLLTHKSLINLMPCLSSYIKNTQYLPSQLDSVPDTSTGDFLNPLDKELFKLVKGTSTSVIDY